MKLLHLKLNIKDWSLQITKTNSADISAVVGKHVTLIDVKILKTLTAPFLLPFPEALYLQTTALGMKVQFFYKLW